MPFQKGFFIPMDEPPEKPEFPGFPGRPGHLPELPEKPEGPVDPGFGFPLPPVIDNSLPGEGKPPHVGGGPITPRPPLRPGQPLPPERPTFPVDPDWGIPLPPWNLPKPPIALPPLFPARPELPIYKPDERPEVSPPIQLPPGSVWPPLPPGVTGKVVAVVWIVGVGYRIAVFDTGLDTGFPLPKPPQKPDGGDKPEVGNPLPPFAQPK